VGQTFYSGCQLYLNGLQTPDKTEWFHQIGLRDSDIGCCVCERFATRCFGHYCDTDIDNMTCNCVGNFRGFCAEDITACCCRKLCNTINTIHQNIYGLGGFAARLCVRDSGGLCCAGCVCGLCNPTQGFGYGAGGPSFSLQHTACHSSDAWFNNCFCSCAVMCWAYGGQAGVACCETCMPIWNGNCCGVHGTCSWSVLMPTGGSAGVIWLCNDFYETHNNFGYWRGRHGLVAIACQDYA